MSRIILQHWAGPMDELVTASSKEFSAYAESLGCDYELVRHSPFMPRIAHKISPCLQKLIYLDEKYDMYDTLVMVDADMFIRKRDDSVIPNIFEDIGIGRHTQIQTNLRAGIARTLPRFGNENAPYWGGSIIKLPLEIRQKFRSLITEEIVMTFANNWVDEGVMHTLANLAGMRHDDEGMYLNGQMWNYSSFEPTVEEANFIHIRTKIRPHGPKDTKLNNYHRLIRQGLLNGTN